MMSRRCFDTDGIRHKLETCDDPLTPAQVADALGVTTQAVYAHVKDGSLKAFDTSPQYSGRPTYRVYKQDLLEYCGITVDRPSVGVDTRYVVEPAYYDRMGGLHVETDLAGRILALWVGDPTRGGERIEVSCPRYPFPLKTPPDGDPSWLGSSTPKIAMV